MINNNCLFIIVESDKKSKTDSIYINVIIEKFFKKYTSLVKIEYIYASGKGNLISSKIINRIKTKSREFNKCELLFVYDTDEYSTNQNDIKINNSITEYARKNNYNVAWFCKDIENVLLNKSIDNNKKLEEAKNFIRNKDHINININKLQASKIKQGSSNIVNILNIIFEELIITTIIEH